MWIRIVLLLLIATGPAFAQERRAVALPNAGAQATFPVEVTFKVIRGSARAEPVKSVPGVFVDLGVGLRSNRASVFWDQPVLARLKSDDEGLLTATLAVPERWRELENACIWARVEASGRRRTIALHSLGGEQDSGTPFLTVRRGATLVGRVLDDQGRAVGGTRVSLIRRRPGRPVVTRRGYTDKVGRFAIEFVVSGKFDVYTRASALGSALVRELELQTRAPFEPLELRLTGGAPLTGRVVDGAGYPVPGLTVTAVLSTGYPGEEVRVLAEAAGGLVVDRTLTDRDGRFVLPHMVPGEYSMHADYTPAGESWLISKSNSGSVLGVLRVPATKAVELVHSVARLEVSVVDHLGAPLDVNTALSGSPGEDRALSVGYHDGTWFERWRCRIAVGDLAVFPLGRKERADPLTVSWNQAGRPLIEEDTAMRPGSGRVAVNLVLSRPEPLAVLEIEVLDGDGWPFLAPVQFLVVSAETGRELAGHFVEGADEGAPNAGAIWSAPLPSGRIRVEVVEGDDFFGWYCGTVIAEPRVDHLRVTQEFELFPGEHRTLEVRLRASGHLDFEPLRERAPPFDAEQAERAERDGVTVTLLSPSGEQFTATEFDTTEVPGAGATQDWIVEGWSARGLDPVPVGTWTLRLERAGELLLEREVTIAAGEVTTVRW